MAHIIFFEKPGCINNTRQKRLLIEAGHELDCRDLLTEPWQAAELRRYFGEQPVAQWFNPSAPVIKRSEVVPETLDEQQALELMLQDPLLIRRPLLRVGERRQAGFDPVTIDRWVGLADSGRIDGESLQHCARTHEREPRCDSPAPCGRTSAS
jgi:nitrogenase-associated protein